MRNLNHLGLGGLFICITCLFISVFVYLKAPKRLLNKSWAIFALFVATYGFGFFMLDISATKEAAFFWWRFAHVGVIFIAVLFLHFNFVLVEIKNRKSLILLYSLNFIFLIFNLFSRLFLKGVSWKFSNVWYADAGILYIYFFLLWWGTVCYSGYLVYKNYKKSIGIKRNQLKYWFIAIVVGYCGGIWCFLPILNINIYPYPIYLVAIWPLILTYAIVRYRTFEIDTVIHRTALWLVTSLWLVLPAYALFRVIRPWLVTLNYLWLTISALGLFYVFLWYYRYFQPRIDHLFRRRKYDYQKVLADLPSKIGSELDIDTVLANLFKELKETIYVRNGLVLLRPPEEEKGDFEEVSSFGYEKPLELKEVEKRKQERRIILKSESNLLNWIKERKEVLEKEQVEIDPQYEGIKNELLSFAREYQLELLIPLIMQNQLLGLLGLGRKENLQAYTIKDVELLKHLGTQLGVTIDNALHHKDIVEKERLAEELKLGREIQMALLPREIPQVLALTVRGLMQPAKEIGGDYYDFITVPNKDSLAIVIGDVSGKGVAAGILMSMVKATIHTLSREEISPRQILLRTNEFLHQHIAGQKFMTLLYFLWQPQIKIFTYSSAGHEHILIYRNSTQQLETIQSGGFMLGMLANIETFLEEKQIQLQPKDKILLYTDGVTEAENQAGERFGLERLKESFQKHSQKPAQELMEAIRDEVYSFIGNYPQYDDITLVVMEAT